MADREKSNQLVKAKTSSLQKISSNIVSRGLSDLVLLDVEKVKIADEEERLSQAREWFERGHKYYFINKDYDNAIEAYTKAIALNPKNPLLWMLFIERASVYRVAKGQYDRAIEDYNRAIALDPNYPEFYYIRGVTYGMKGQYDKAIDDYNKVITINPNDAKAYYNRGNAYAHKGQFNRAIEDFNKAIAFFPNDASTYLKRGRAYERLGNKSMAISDYRKACDLGSKVGCENLKRVLREK